MLVQSGSLVYRHDAFLRLRTVAQGAMGSDCVVGVQPSFDQDLGLAQRLEDFTIGNEGFTIAVFPQRPG